ncbi:MAG: hypothetical protein J5740_01615 [Bacteroidales bacterium]|nr:hypothetical protein [Bacteroidales bacterium]
MSSDPDKCGAIDEGTYIANYDPLGKKAPLPSHWLLKNSGENSSDEIRMIHGKINPLHPNQRLPNGEGYKNGIFIHRTNLNGYAGGYVSTGCLLLAPNDFFDFETKVSGVNSFVVQLSRKKLFP